MIKFFYQDRHMSGRISAMNSFWKNSFHKGFRLSMLLMLVVFVFCTITVFAQNVAVSKQGNRG
jgi:hypothetical protein